MLNKISKYIVPQFLLVMPIVAGAQIAEGDAGDIGGFVGEGSYLH